jgi:putative ABC transport system permease protein
MLLKLFFRNAFRHKLRTGLTIGGICVALTAFGMLRTMIDAWYAGVAASSANRLVVRNAISLTFFLPLSYRDKIREVDGVRAVSYGTWFGGIYADPKNFFANFAVDASTYLRLYPEFVVPPDQLTAFLRDRKGCVVGRGLIRRFGWKLGDSVTLKGAIFPGSWDFVIRGIYRGRDRTIDENQFFLHWDYLNERLKARYARRADQVGFYVIEIANPDIAAVTAAAVDRQFKNSLAETLTETERAFQMSFVSLSETILTAIRLVSLVIIVIIMAVVANTMVMSVRERTAEFAIFKTLGFGRLYLGGLILGESLVISAIGAVVGIAATFPAVRILAGLVGHIFPVMGIASQTILLDLLTALTVGGVAAVFPIWRVIRVPIIEGLGRIG